MRHDNEEWCKIWREINLSIQNSHEKFGKFWPKHSKISKFCVLMDCFWPKYIMFELKKVKRSYFWWHWILIQNLKEKWLEEFSKFSTEHVWKSFRHWWGHWWGSFIESRKCMSLKFTGEFCIMTIKMMQNLKRNWVVSSKLTWGI